MEKVLDKRILRDLKKNSFRYLALFLLIVMGMYMVISLVGAAESVIVRVGEAAQKNHVEDGEFTVFVPLEDKITEELKEKGITLEKSFYLDYILSDKSTLRIYKNRENVNRIDLDEGSLADNNNEIVLEKHYAKKHELTVGSTIKVAGNEYKVTGIGSVPDYDIPLKNMSDSSAESKLFGMGFVTENCYGQLKEKGNSSKTEEYVYSYLLAKGMSSDELKGYLRKIKLDISKVEDTYFLEMIENSGKSKTEIQDGVSKLSNGSNKRNDGLKELAEKNANIDNLTQFLKKADNPRIGASIDDVQINKNAGIVAGIIVMVLFTYVISVFVIHGIEQESSVIGALYALGVNKKQLIRHYLKLPVIITFMAGIIGTAIGFSPYGVSYQTLDSVNYFSLPVIKTVYPVYLLVYGAVMPPVVAAIVNFFVINKKLSQPALKLLRNEQKQSKISNVNLGKLKFVLRFQIRQFLREIRTSFTVVFGMFIALLIMMIGIDCYVICHNMSVQNKKDTNYKYMYSYKYPTPKVPNGGEACYAEGLKKEVMGYDLDVTLLGIDKDNKYFDFNVADGKNKVAISQSVATKYKLSAGEKIVLSDNVNDMDYAFTINKVVPYSVGLYVFMDIDSMRSLFNQKDDYFNLVLSDKALNIDAGRLYATTTKDDISKSADVFMNNMWSMIVSMIGVSIIIFIVVMYLMMKVMIDRSAFNISLMKIFGYNEKEVRNLYIDGNFVMIVVSAAICIPLAKMAMDEIYPYLISNVACGMDLRFSWQVYIGIFVAVLICYLIINKLLVRRLKKMVPAEVLKNRE